MDNIIKKEINYYKQKYKHYFKVSHPLYNSKFIDNSPDVYINNSIIHGLGVFANRNINKDEFLTVYPAHYIAKLNNYPIYNINYKLPNNYIDYGYDLDIKNNIVMVGNPNIKTNMLLIGHLCNDGYKHNYKYNTKKNRNSYNKKTKQFNNAIFYQDKDYVVQIISTKNIKKDEEILVSYGFNYWLKRNLHNN